MLDSKTISSKGTIRVKNLSNRIKMGSNPNSVMEKDSVMISVLKPEDMGTLSPSHGVLPLKRNKPDIAVPKLGRQIKI